MKNQLKNLLAIKKRCYLCGDASHVQSLCPTKEKGIKCFKCNEYGHRGCDKVCPKYDERNGNNKNKQEKMMCLSKEKSVKTVQLSGFDFEALIDTGSEINAITKSVFDKLKISYDVGACRSFIGAGKARVKTNKS